MLAILQIPWNWGLFVLLGCCGNHRPCYTPLPQTRLHAFIGSDLGSRVPYTLRLQHFISIPLLSYTCSTSRQSRLSAVWVPRPLQITNWRFHHVCPNVDGTKWRKAPRSRGCQVRMGLFYTLHQPWSNLLIRRL